MINLNKTFYIVLFVVFYTLFAFSSIQDNLILNIELANPKIYIENDEIFINIKIINNSEKQISSTIASDKKYSFDLQMVTIQNRTVEHNRDYYISFHKTQPIFNSLIVLEPQESYTYRIKLNDFFDLKRIGQFFIKGFYYPNLKIGPKQSVVLTSNTLTINIRPATIDYKITDEKINLEKEKKLFAEKRPPDEVIKYMLDARMHKEWDKFFLYLDLKKLVQTNKYFKERYNKASEEAKLEIIDQYKEFLKDPEKNQSDKYISYLPHKYDIINTQYTKGDGKVDVVISFKYLEYIEQKYYTYFLHKVGNIWLIYNYEVLNMPTQ